MKSQIIFAIVVIVAAIGLLVSYDSVYAESANRGGSFNNGASHSQCTAAASGPTCDISTDNGKHTGLFN
jgi:hypothetical protein